MKRSVKEQESRKGMKVEEIFAALDMLEKEKGIPQHYMMDKITQALINAYKYDHPDVEEVLVRVDEEHRTLKMYIQKTVVDEVEKDVYKRQARRRHPVSHRLGRLLRSDFFAPFFCIFGRRPVAAAWCILSSLFVHPANDASLHLKYSLCGAALFGRPAFPYRDKLHTPADTLSLIHIFLLDVMLPVLDGWSVLSRVREASRVPVIMLTAKGETFDKINGLNMGADDYVVKPFEMKELLALSLIHIFGAKHRRLLFHQAR